MTPLLSVILLFLIAYLGWIIYQKMSARSTFFNHFGASGSIYLLVGFLVGPHLFGLITPEIIEDLNVLVGLVLGWTGFLIGLQAKRRELMRFQESYYLFASINFIIMLGTSIALLFMLREYLYPGFSIGHLTILAIAGAISSPILMALLRKDYRVRGQRIHLLQFSAAYDNMLGVIVFGIALILFNPVLDTTANSILALLASLLFSALMAYLFLLISKQLKNEQQFFLVLIGFLLIIVGVALNINISLLFISFTFGAVLTNLPVEINRLYHSIEQAEKPLYFLMLVFVGASVHQIDQPVFYLLLAFVFFRSILKITTAMLTRYSIILSARPTAAIGLPYLGMGGVAVAMILDYHVSYMDIYSTSLLFIISISMISNSLLSPKIFKRTL